MTKSDCIWITWSISLLIGLSDVVVVVLPVALSFFILIHIMVALIHLVCPFDKLLSHIFIGSRDFCHLLDLALSYGFSSALTSNRWQWIFLSSNERGVWVLGSLLSCLPWVDRDGKEHCNCKSLAKHWLEAFVWFVELFNLKEMWKGGPFIGPENYS